MWSPVKDDSRQQRQALSLSLGWWYWGRVWQCSKATPVSVPGAFPAMTGIQVELLRTRQGLSPCTFSGPQRFGLVFILGLGATFSNAQGPFLAVPGGTICGAGVSLCKASVLTPASPYHSVAVSPPPQVPVLKQDN